jgi:hypothetical protein
LFVAGWLLFTVSSLLDKRPSRRARWLMTAEELAQGKRLKHSAKGCAFC